MARRPLHISLEPGSSHLLVAAALAGLLKSVAIGPSWLRPETDLAKGQGTQRGNRP